MVRLLTLSGLILLLAAPVASAGTREKILRECQEGRITGDYTPRQLRDARKNIPTDIDEYSDCRDVLARAALTGRSGTGGSGRGGTAAPGGVLPGGGGGTGEVLAPAGDSEHKALNDARADAGTLFVDGERVSPAAVGFSGARHGLPTTLLIALILLGLCGAAAAAPVVHQRVRARREP